MKREKSLLNVNKQNIGIKGRMFWQMKIFFPKRWKMKKEESTEPLDEVNEELNLEEYEKLIMKQMEKAME